MRRIRTVPRLLDPRPRSAHKASVGRVLVVGGSRDLCGAPALTALGALRSGAGLVRMAVPRSIQGVIAGLRAEATTAGLTDTSSGSLADSALGEVKSLLPSWDALVLGPGGGREEETLRLLVALACEATLPTVLDADALFAIGTHLDTLKGRAAPTVLTPHEGEAGRLLGVSSEEIRADREKAALEIVRQSGAIAVLKGPGTIVTDGERIYQCSRGGCYLASGGTGDVLAGVVGAFLAGLPSTGKDAFGAACAAVYVHGAAADSLGSGLDRGLLASDVAHALPRAVAQLVEAGRRAPERPRRMA